MADSFKVALAGLGTVGIGVLKLLAENQDIITRRAGRAIEVTHVSARERGRDRGFDLSGFAWEDDAKQLSGAPVDAVVELMGGSDGPALVLARDTLGAGKHFVTANKALIAHHGLELSATAERAGAHLLFEAAVAGGIPVVKALGQGLAANEISSVHGILNGTCNYILSVMDKEGRAFDDVLADAQRLGYAEADPTFDIDGIDAAHKLAILASMAFGTEIDFASVATDGIRAVSPIDLDYARELGYRIKLIGSAALTDAGLEQRVSPCLLPEDHPLAQVEDSFNAVVFEGNHVDRVVLEGRGAGAGPTASAVVADIIDLARGYATPAFGIPSGELSAVEAIPADEQSGRFYMRLEVADEVGVAACVATVMRDNGISMDSLIQRGDRQGDAVTFVLTTHRCTQAQVAASQAALDALPSTKAQTVMMRMKNLHMS